jgi:hypothetical protein
MHVDLTSNRYPLDALDEIDSSLSALGIAEIVFVFFDIAFAHWLP